MYAIWKNYSDEKIKSISVSTDFTPQHPVKVLSQSETNLWDLRFDVLCSAPPNPITTVVTRQPITNQDQIIFLLLFCSRFRNVLTSAILPDSLPFLRTDGSNVSLNGRGMGPLLKPPSHPMPQSRKAFLKPKRKNILPYNITYWTALFMKYLISNYFCN